MPCGRWHTHTSEQDDNYRKECPELWTSYDAHFPDPNRPGTSALALALCRLRSQSLIAARPINSVQVTPSHLPPEVEAARLAMAETTAEIERYRRVFRGAGLQDEISELLDWLFPQVTEQNKIDLRPAFESRLELAGWSPEEVKLFLSQSMPPRRGAKIQNRQNWLKAWDEKLLSPDTKFSELAERYCSCAKKVTGHDGHCAEALRKGVASLRKLALQHGVLEFAEVLAAGKANRK